MIKPKTTKYCINVYLGDNLLVTSIDISRKTFDAKLAELIDQQAQQQIDDEFYTTYEQHTRHSGHVTVHSHCFDFGTSAIHLIKGVCDDGYAYTK